MRASVALQRYLQRHTETGLPDCTLMQPRWHQVVVLPAYRESATLLGRLQELPVGGRGRSLVILVLNRPESDLDPAANSELRAAVSERMLPPPDGMHLPLAPLGPYTDLYLHDMEALCGPTPAAAGVGLVRKTGFDLALHWMAQGAIGGSWICSTDADATLPPDYFEQLSMAPANAVAAVFPFRHVPGGDPMCDAATALYELRLRYYVRGLELAGSPYAYHTLGSCLAVRAAPYAQVRGFPKRAAAEDFYLLNKLAKIGPVARLQGGCVQLQSRHSCRVPFGTGPAVASIISGGHPADARIFDHPDAFAALGALLRVLPQLVQAQRQDMLSLLTGQGLDAGLAAASCKALEEQGIQTALTHCERQSSSGAQFLRQFHQWFDAFRTLKLMHALRDAGWQQLSLHQLDALQPAIWRNVTDA